MSTIVYQELQSSCNNNTESRTLSLKLNSSKKNSLENSSSCGGWSSIEALPSKIDAKAKEDAIYIHPLVKRSSYMLSEKSLKMCTESLGCETGTCDMESLNSFFPSSSSSTTTMKGRTPRQKFDIRKELSFDHGKFPPPLNTISGSSTIRVRPYRKDGRLVIEAISSPTIQPYMQAERSDGRLKLSMLREAPSDINDEHEDEDCKDIGGNGVEDELVEKEEVEEKDVEKDVGKEEFEECNKNEAYLIEDMNGINVELGVKLGIGKIQRPSRCKERGQGKNKRLINWEPFWVAT